MVSSSPQLSHSKNIYTLQSLQQKMYSFDRVCVCVCEVDGVRMRGAHILKKQTDARQHFMAG